MLVYIAAVLTVLTATALASLVNRRRATAPRIAVSGYQADSHAGLVPDPTDVGVRVTEVEVGSPLTFVGACYRLDLPDLSLRLDDATHEQVVTALRAADVDDATWIVTLLSPGAHVLPGRATPMFVLTLPLVRRLRVLEADLTWRDPQGRTVTKTVSALPKQPLGRPVRAGERAGARA